MKKSEKTVKKSAWQCPALTPIGSVADVTLAVNVVGGGDAQFSVLNAYLS